MSDENKVAALILDLETTGFSKKDRIIQIGAILVDCTQMVLSEFMSMVNPEETKMNYYAQQAHHISTQTLQTAETFRVVWLRFLTWIHETTRSTPDVRDDQRFRHIVVVAHNGKNLTFQYCNENSIARVFRGRVYRQPNGRVKGRVHRFQIR